jgi:hypothetical protein
MSRIEGEFVVIDLGVAERGSTARSIPAMSVRLRRFLVGGLTAVLVLATVIGSAGGGPSGLGRPLWTGTVSLNGFTLGATSLYQATTDATVVIGRDLATGRVRWTVDVPSADLPDSTTDVGHGVAAVVTRRLAQDPERPVYTITFVRESGGERIGQTTGYFFLPGAAADPLVVFTDAAREADGCRPGQLSCMDVTAWDVGTATVRWRLHLPPGTIAIPSLREGTFGGLADLAPDGTMRLRDLATGSVVGTLRLRSEYLTDGQMVLTRDAFVTALRGDGIIEVTAYRRPALVRIWSVTVPAPPVEASEYRFRGGIRLTDCGSDIVCLYPDRLAGRIIATPTGDVTPALRYELIHGIGSGLFLASQIEDGNPPTPTRAGYVVDYTGRIIATLPVNNMVPWEDSGAILATREGPVGTEFLVIDPQGRERTVDTVPGTGLTCLARDRYLSCSDRIGNLRTWRLPAWTVR